MIYVLNHIFSRAPKQNINWILIRIFIFKCLFNLKRKKLCFSYGNKNKNEIDSNLTMKMGCNKIKDRKLMSINFKVAPIYPFVNILIDLVREEY